MGSSYLFIIFRFNLEINILHFKGVLKVYARLKLMDFLCYHLIKYFNATFSKLFSFKNKIYYLDLLGIEFDSF